MKLPSLLNSSSLPKFAWWIILGAGEALACGPDFPNRYLDQPAQLMLAAPEGFFAVEIERLAPAPARRVASRGDEEKEDERETDDLRAALRKRGDPAARITKLAAAYRVYRAKLRKASEEPGATCPERPPEGLPEEFSRYLAGAAAWYENRLDAARAEWQAVLALPAAERHFRSTWAAYMLGRIEEENFPPNGSLRWFEEVRRLAKAGFADSINLVGESYGMEARWALALRDCRRAIDLYLEQYATGDESAYLSLRIAAAAAAGSESGQLEEIARDPRARLVVTAWFLARFTPAYGAEPDPIALRAWTAALVRAQVRDIDHADRLAWLAYESGDFDLAGRWVEMALDSSAETHWIRGKLALRENRLGAGANELARAASSPDLAPIYRSTVLGELGRVLLAMDRREEALTAWLDGLHWQDAAYVAERLLTIDELKCFQAHYCPAGRPLYEPFAGEVISPQSLAQPMSVRPDFREEPPGPSLQSNLGELLARRLVRAGRVEEAKDYYGEKHRVVLEAYVAEVQAGFNVMLNPKKRARAFWRAARLVREDGMDLMGAELEPDFAIWGGWYSAYGAVEERLKLDAGPFGVTAEERGRLAAIAIPAKRFSYRYRAADLAWWAASLLPNDNDETAAVLNTAGSWLKSRDPVEANRFYQALVIRCGRTKLGRAAAERHWFPDGV